MDTSSYRFEGVARALSAISHLGDSTGGTVSIFRREKVYSQNYGVIEVPILSGNAFRGQLRDTGMRFMLRELGDPQLSPAAFHFLTSGGSLTKDVVGRGLEIGQARKLRSLIPLVGVFGGACGRQILEGKLKVGKWYPICQELAEFVPKQYQQQAMQTSIYDLTDLHSFTRMDDAKSEKWQKLLPQEQRALLEAPKVKQAKDGTEIAEKPGTAQQMRYSQEVLIAGTRFYCWLQLEDVTDLEYEAFASALVEWSKAPFVGGQSRHGCGEVELKFDNWMSVSPLAQFGTKKAIGMPVGTTYIDHLHSQRESILEALSEIG